MGGAGIVVDDSGVPRCWWAAGTDDYKAYHDHEWGVVVHGEAMLFERLTLEAFQSGLSWLTILRKREGFRAAFAGFDAEAVASFGEADIERLMADTSIVRNRLKIRAAVTNAHAVVALRAHGGLDELFWSFAPVGHRRPRTPADVPATSAVGLAFFGVASFALTMKVLIPYFNARGRVDPVRLAVLPGTGSLPQRVLDLVLEVVTPGPKATTVLLLLVVTAFLALRSRLIIAVLPTLGWRLISSNQNFGGQSFHYDLVLMPIIFAALVDAAVHARRGRWRPLRWYARAAPVLAVLVGVFFCTRYAFKDLVVPATYQPSPRAKAADRVLSQIPDGATVETDLGLIAKLTNRTRVFYVGGAAPVVPQFFLIDDKAGWSPPLPDPVKYAESLHPGATYVFVTGGDGYRLLRRVP